MKELNLRNLTIMALVACCLIQVGAQLYALSVVASTVSAAPPRSFAILQGEYRYDSSSFWEIVPTITFVLFVIALVANWKTPRRKLLLLALSLFVVGGLVAGLYLEPMFDEMKAIGYRDEVDPVLQSRAATWYAFDWMVWALGAASGVTLLLALVRPVMSPQPATSWQFRACQGGVKPVHPFSHSDIDRGKFKANNRRKLCHELFGRSRRIFCLGDRLGRRHEDSHLYFAGMVQRTSTRFPGRR